MEKLKKILSDLMASSFYGSLEIRFEAGKIVHIIKKENIKP